MSRFPRSEMMTLTDAHARYDLAESVGPDLRLSELLGPDGDLGALRLGYGTAAGNPALRALLAQAHGVDAEDVVVTMGGMHALFLLGFILCGPGGEAVTTSPTFPVAGDALEAVGATVRTLPLSFDDGYRVDVAALHRTLTPATRLVSLASPQNPSGVAVPAETLRQVLAAMDEVCPEAYLLVDETYREACYGDAPAADSAIGLSAKVVAVGSLSKCHGAPGLRLGWAVTRDRELRAQLVQGKFTTVISCSPLDEALAIRALEQRDRIIGARRRHLAEGLAMTAAWVKANEGPVDWVRPDAGALCCIRLKPGVFDEAAVAQFYETLSLQDARVASGHWFGESTRVFRLGFGLLPMPELETGLARLSRALRATTARARLSA